MRRRKTPLVHRPFARETGWDDCRKVAIPQTGCPFVSGLRDQMAKRRVEMMFEPFHSSGDTSRQARRKAAVQLNNRIQRIKSLFTTGPS